MMNVPWNVSSSITRYYDKQKIEERKDLKQHELLHRSHMSKKKMFVKARLAKRYYIWEMLPRNPLWLIENHQIKFLNDSGASSSLLKKGSHIIRSGLIQK